MELIDRYVNAIARRLPRKQRSDVRKELRSTLYDALESRVQGGPTEEDVVRLLREFGHPKQVAASYRPSSQYLIGPELYPMFKMVVGIVVLALTAVLVGTFAVTLLFHPSESMDIGHRLSSLLTGIVRAVLNAVGMILLVFVILQRFEVRIEERETSWDPRDLPVVRDMDLIGRGEAVAGVVFPAICLVLLHLFRDRIGLVMSPGQEPLLNHVLVENLPWLSAALLLGMGLHAVLLWQGRWHWSARLADFAVDGFGVYVLYRIATDVVAEKATLAEAGMPGPLPEMVAQLATSIVVVVGVLVIVHAANVLIQILRRRSAELG